MGYFLDVVTQIIDFMKNMNFTFNAFGSSFSFSFWQFLIANIVIGLAGSLLVRGFYNLTIGE